jgi:hypothetical protein
MKHDWDPNDQQNWEMNCEAERKAKPLRDINGDILNTGDLVWLTNDIQKELAIVLGESHRENVLVRPVKGGYDFTIYEMDCEKVKKNETIL